MKIRHTGFLAQAAVSRLSAQRGKAATGKSIFDEKCISYHGENGRGQVPAGKALHVKNLNSREVQKQSEAELTAAIKKGKGKMPAFEGVSAIRTSTSGPLTLALLPKRSE